MAKKQGDRRVIDLAQERAVAFADPRMPPKIEDWRLTRPKDLPGMNGRKIRSVDDLKSYISKIPPAPRNG